MKAGNLRERVTLQQMTSTRNDYGEEIKTWTDVATFWAHVIPLKGSEVFAENERTNEQVFKVRFRPRKDLTKADRLTWNGFTLEVLTIPMDPSGRGNESFVECRVIL